MTAVVPNQRRATLQPFVIANVQTGGNVHTDELASYKCLGTAGYRHATVNHGAEEYDRGALYQRNAGAER